METVVENRKYTLREWLNEHGTVIIGMFRKHEIGDICPDPYDATCQDRIDQPLVIIREATREEYISQMAQAGHIVQENWFRVWYEVTTD